MSQQPTQPTQQEIDDVRAKTMEVTARAKNDAAFKQQLQDDPQSTLKAAGLPEAAIAEIGKKSGDDVSGYVQYNVVCWYYTSEYTWDCTYYTY